MQNAPLRITIHCHALVENEAARLLGRTSRRSSSSGTAGGTARNAAVTAALKTAAVGIPQNDPVRWTSRPVPAGACLPARPQLRLDSSTLFALNASHGTGLSLRQYSTATARSATHLSLRHESSALAGPRSGARRQHTRTAHDKADAEDDRLLPHGRSSRSRGPDAAQINRVSLA